MKKRIDWGKAVATSVFVTLLISAAYVIIMIIFSPSTGENVLPSDRTKSDYVLMLLQCVMGMLAMLLPGFIEHKVKIIIPSRMLIMYALFLYASIYLGDVRNFYYTIPHWDTILHTFSGGMLGALGFSLAILLNDIDKVPIQLNASFVAIFTFCFAVTLGVVWEIYEYTFDGLLGLNMQKYITQSGEILVGRAALADTMKDLIVDCAGAFVISISGYISLKYKKGWVERLLLKRKKTGI
ncbi:MAG: hypothetical protein M0R40_10025 [Firmicutes bacterium]|nr:hypothetical protein [Bacillota bacterium]